MPTKAPVVCRAYGCRNATISATGYCENCGEAAGSVAMKRRMKKANPFYGTARWKKFRSWYAKKHPLCEDCQELGKVVAMNVVDHIVELKDGGAALAESNARSLCTRCHSRKTAEAKQLREGGAQSPPTPPALPFGSLKLPLA